MLSQQEPMSSRIGCHCQPVTGSSRKRQIGAGLSSLLIMLVLPKCPMCVVTYVAIWTGLGISITQAGYLLWTVLLTCGIVLASLATKSLRREIGRQRPG